MSIETRSEQNPVDRVRNVFNQISSSSRFEVRFRGAPRESFGQMMRRQAVASNEGFTAIEDLVTKAILRERSANAEIASRFSPDAANEILSRPMPEKWEI